MPTPTEHAWREYLVFLRGPSATNRFAFGTTEERRSNAWHQPLLQTFPEPTDNESDDFGVMGGGGFTVEIADETDDLDWFLLLGDGDSFLLLGDGSRLVFGY